MNFTKRVLLYFSIVLCSCSPKNEEVEFTDHSELKIELTNYEEFEIYGSMATVGTSKSFYFEKERPKIIIKNLPDHKIKVKANGIELMANQSDGLYTYQPKTNLGYQSNSIQIFDSLGIEIFEHKVRFHVGRIKPFLESEHGDFLFKGVTTKFEVSNVAMGCPNIVLSSEHAEIKANANGTYSVLPNQHMDTVEIKLRTNHESWKQEYYVLDAPPPSFYFSESDQDKCVELVPSSLFSKVNYTIVEMIVIENSTGTKSKIKNSNCILNSNRFRIQQFTYAIDDFDEAYTILLE